MAEDDHSKIVDFLRKNGPSHPIQISKVLDKDSFMTSAILSEAVEAGRVKRTNKNVGNAPIYYLEGQRKEAMSLVQDSLKLLEKKVLKMFKEKGVVPHDELKVQERFVLKNLRDFVVPLNVKSGSNEMTIWKLKGVSNDKVGEVFNRRVKERSERKKEEKEPEKDEEKIEKDESIFKRRRREAGKEEPEGEKEERKEPEEKDEEPEEKEEEKEEEVDEFEARVKEKLKEMDAEILEKNVVRKGSEINFVVEFERPFGHRCLVKGRGKKRISKSDLSVAYTEGIDKKMPVMFLTYGKISKKNKEYAEKKFGDMLTIVRMEE